MQKREGLVQAHADLPKLVCMVLGNITVKLNWLVKTRCLRSQGAEVCRDVLS